MMIHLLVKKTVGIILAFLIFVIVLFFLMRTYNQNESTKIKAENKSMVFLKRGNPEVFKEWAQISYFPPLSEVRYTGLKGDEVIFDVRYRFDKNTLRDEKKDAHKKESHLILGGCSVIFGSALDEGDTLSSFLRKKMPSVNVMNFGQEGGGLHTQIRSFELLNFNKFIPENKGLYLYFFYYDHLSRWKGTAPYLSWAKPESVHYEVKGETLKLMSLRDFSGYKNFVKAKKAGLDYVYLKANVYNEDWSEKDLSDFVTGVKKLKDLYLRRYPEGRFLFTIYPFMPETEVRQNLKRLLAQERIDYYDADLDFRLHLKKENLTHENFAIPVDGHPNREFNDFLSSAVKMKLGL